MKSENKVMVIDDSKWRK